MYNVVIRNKAERLDGRIRMAAPRSDVLLPISTRPDSWTRLSVVGRDGVVDVDEDSGLISSVSAWEGNKGTRGPTASTSDLDLGA